MLVEEGAARGAHKQRSAAFMPLQRGRSGSVQMVKRIEEPARKCSRRGDEAEETHARGPGIRLPTYGCARVPQASRLRVLGASRPESVPAARRRPNSQARTPAVRSRIGRVGPQRTARSSARPAALRTDAPYPPPVRLAPLRRFGARVFLTSAATRRQRRFALAARSKRVSGAALPQKNNRRSFAAPPVAEEGNWLTSPQPPRLQREREPASEPRQPSQARPCHRPRAVPFP